MRKNILKENVDMKKKLSEKTKEQKAITLIALVITIIVLLILSSVSIAMLTGENGIIGKATSPRILLTQNGKNIEISITERGENITVLEILDSIDQVIASATKESMTKNEQSYVFNYSFTAEGTYVVKLATQQGKEYTKEVIIDLTPPANPVISSNYGYPVITENGVKQDGTTKITYEIGENIDNYYSLDGTNWHKYTGEFQYAQTGTIYAKSVKKSNGTETKVSKTISIPSDALGAAAYDGSDTTYVKMPYGGDNNGKVEISPNMIGKNVRVKVDNETGEGGEIYVRNSTGGLLAKYDNYRQEVYIITIPNGADYLSFYSCSEVYEVAPYDS